MSRPRLAEWLVSAGAHHDVVDWAGPFEADWERAWRECPRADWLLGLAARLGVPRERLVLSAAGCARTTLDQLGAEAELVLRGIEAAEAWAQGAETLQRCRDLAGELERAPAPDPTVAAALAAAHATLLAVDDPDAAASAAANAAQAVMFSAGDCAMMALLSYAQKTCAAIVREHIEFALIELHSERA